MVYLTLARTVLISLATSHLYAEITTNTSKTHESLLLHIQRQLHQAQQSLMRARHTFSRELVMMTKLNEPDLDEYTYLTRYQDLIDHLVNRYKHEVRTFAHNEWSAVLNTALWGKCSLRTPLCQAVDLIQYTLADLTNHHRALAMQVRLIPHEPPDRHEAEQLLSDLQTMIDLIMSLNSLVQSNNHYVYERYEIKHLMSTMAFAYSAPIVLGALATLVFIVSGGNPAASS